jgi:hypothetical protein
VGSVEIKRMIMKKKTKNKQDLTTRNLSAAKKREAKLEKRVEVLERSVALIDAYQRYVSISGDYDLFMSIGKKDKK